MIENNKIWNEKENVGDLKISKLLKTQKKCTELDRFEAIPFLRQYKFYFSKNQQTSNKGFE